VARALSLRNTASCTARTPSARCESIRTPSTLAHAVALVALAACQGASEPAPEAPSDVLASGRADRTVAATVIARLAAEPAVDASLLVVSVEDGTVNIASDQLGEDVLAQARQFALQVDGVVAVAGTDAPAPVPQQTLHAWLEASIRVGSARAATSAPSEASGESEPDASDGSAAEGSDDRPRTYVVQPGETLSRVAEKTMGSARAWRRLHEYNRRVIGPDPARVRDGMVLRIPPE